MNKHIKKALPIGGFVFSYLVFTTILYFILYFLNKLPSDWNFFQVCIITFFITALGAIIYNWEYVKKIKPWLVSFKRGMNFFGQIISNLINSILLLIVYVIGVGITSIVAKTFKKKFLNMRLDFKAETYWEELGLSKRPIEEYYRQF